MEAFQKYCRETLYRSDSEYCFDFETEDWDTEDSDSAENTDGTEDTEDTEDTKNTEKYTKFLALVDHQVDQMKFQMSNVIALEEIGLFASRHTARPTSGTSSGEQASAGSAPSLGN